MLASLPKLMTQGRSLTSQALGLAFAGALAYALFRILEPFFSPILWAILLAFLLFPANRRLRQRLGGRKGVAAMILSLAALVGIVVPAGLLMLAFVSQGSELLNQLSSMAERYKIARPSDILHIPVVDSLLHRLQDKIPFTADQVQSWLVDGLRGAIYFLLQSGRTAFLGALGAVVSLALTLFLVYFFFRDGDEFAARAIHLIPTDEGRKKRLVEHLSAVTRAVVLGSLVTAVAQGAFLALGFWISGLPSPVVFGVLAGVCALLPVGGTAFVWVPGALLLGAQGRWGWAIFLFVWGAVIVGSADNVLKPMLISGRAEISTLAVFIGVLGGLAAFGMIGMFLGPVLVALALELFRFAEEGLEPPLARRES
jgi:predicted PurR-regulated permease PerM